MRRFFHIFLLLFATCPAVSAQHGTAEDGYYPDHYSGDTWTGIVASVSDNTREVTLTFTRGAKTESFVGILEKGYLAKPVKGAGRELNPSDLRLGIKIKVYYHVETKKVQDKKIKINRIFLIEGIPNLAGRRLQFKAF
jgi:hypothetical protein